MHLPLSLSRNKIIMIIFGFVLGVVLYYMVSNRKYAPVKVSIPTPRIAAPPPVLFEPPPFFDPASLDVTGIQIPHISTPFTDDGNMSYPFPQVYTPSLPPFGN